MTRNVTRSASRCAWLAWIGLMTGCAGTPDEGEPAPPPSATTDAATSPSGPESGPGTSSAPPASAPAASGRPAPRTPPAPWSALPDMGLAKDYFRAHGQRTLVDRGYFRGDVTLAGPGLTKEGEGSGETVIDGDLTVQGEGWVLRDMTITGNVELRGDGNDLSRCQVLGRVISTGKTNKVPPGK